jgi:hypothetical protein
MREMPSAPVLGAILNNLWKIEVCEILTTRYRSNIDHNRDAASL